MCKFLGGLVKAVSKLLLAVICISQLIFAQSSLKSLTIRPENAAQLNSLGRYPGLEALSISCLEDLKALPESITTLKNLRELTIDNGNGCSMNPQIPESIGRLGKLARLTLYGAQDPRDEASRKKLKHREFPKSMAHLTSLEYLNLGRNGYKEIPPFVRYLPKLRQLEFEFNELTQMPQFLSEMKELESLNLSGNHLSDIPSTFKFPAKLTKVNLGYNCDITQNPTTVARLKQRFPKIKFNFEDEFDCPAR